MIARLALGHLRRLARQFPAVLILGPRQCGKTTLARHFLKGTYLDLEKPSDRQIFSGDAEFALRRLKEPIILDEAQTLPSLFPTLRALIDENRSRTGRFHLLGSVDPALVRGISESLAGRVGILELTPFLFPELQGHGVSIFRHWLRGGFPDASREKRGEKWQRWLESYVQTYVERDVARYGVKTSAIEMRRFLGMCAHLHGGLLNASDLGRSLGVTYHTIQSYLDLLEGHYLVRRLPPYFPNIGKRLVKAPKLYLRDSGLLHYLLGIRDERGILESPRRGFSWEGLMIEQLIALEKLRRAGTGFYFFRTHAGAEIDLVFDRGQEKVGFEFKCADSATAGDASALNAAVGDGIITRGFVVHMGLRRYPISKNIEAIGARELLMKKSA